MRRSEDTVETSLAWARALRAAALLLNREVCRYVMACRARLALRDESSPPAPLSASLGRGLFPVQLRNQAVLRDRRSGAAPPRPEPCAAAHGRPRSWRRPRRNVRPCAEPFPQRDRQPIWGCSNEMDTRTSSGRGFRRDARPRSIGRGSLRSFGTRRSASRRSAFRSRSTGRTFKATPGRAGPCR